MSEATKDAKDCLRVTVLASTFALSPLRVPRINGDTRRRKRRLREKLEKKDAIRYAPEIRAACEEFKRRLKEKIERRLFKGSKEGGGG